MKLGFFKKLFIVFENFHTHGYFGIKILIIKFSIATSII